MVNDPDNCWTALYRHFDEDGELLYVGISLSTVSRLSQHSNGAPWYVFITRIDVEWFSTRLEALHAEIAAIKAEGPIFNTQHANDAARAVRIRRVQARAKQAQERLKRRRAGFKSGG